jgi:uncharacterized protein (TIGR03435 family)
MAVSSILAQQPPAPAQRIPRFEAATIRPSASDSPQGDMATWQLMPHGDVTFTNSTLRMIIAIAYEVEFAFQNTLILGSSELLKQRFDIRAKAPDASSVREGTAMLRALLEDRFALRTHVETRQIPLFALTRVRAVRLGSGLRSSEVDCTRADVRAQPRDATLTDVCYGSRRDSQRMRLRESGPLSMLIFDLHNGFVDRPIRDETGLDGLFQWDLTFAVDRNPAADSPFPPLESAIQDQLGLRLVPRMGPWDVRVIDSVEPPTEN